MSNVCVRRFPGRILDGVSGAGSVRKVGTGTQTLSGQAAWTGSTCVDSGILELPTGMGLPGAPVSVGGGAELRAANVVNRVVTGEGHVTAIGPLVIGDMTSTQG